MAPGISGHQFGSFQMLKDSAEYEEPQFMTHVGDLHDIYLDNIASSSSCDGEETSKIPSLNSPELQENGEKSYAIPSASLEIMRNYRSKFRRVNEDEKIEKQSPSTSSLSTDDIIELAAVNFINSNMASVSTLSHPYATAFLGLSPENTADVQLVQDLLSCAEKVSDRHYLEAGKLLAGCHKLKFRQENVIRRLVYYFAEALYDKIDRETGRFSTAKSMIMKNKSSSDPIITAASAFASFHQKLPSNQIAQFAGIQEMVDHASSCKKIHIIELEMRCGLQQVILMKALAARNESPLKSYKITAVALTTSSDHQIIEEASVRLRILADSLRLSFSFQVIKVEELPNLHKKSSHRDSADEKTVVYASNALKYMIVRPNVLESLMRFIRNINPCVMIVCEPEGNVNSPVFVNRFVEALFYYSAYFDCVEDCMKSDAAEREFVEANLLSPIMGATVANEGEKRRSRIVGINVWRAFFAKFGMVEKELSALALNHANLVLKMFECRDSCTLGLNGKSLIINWKGTPICSLSAWKFQRMLLSV